VSDPFSPAVETGDVDTALAEEKRVEAIQTASMHEAKRAN